MEERFNRMIEVILRHEGGYVDDPDDLGGETKYGITKRRYPDLDIANLTIEDATEIYYRDFYLKLNLHYIEDDLLALHILDMGVNAGPSTAVKLLQALLPSVAEDGVIGPMTAEAVKEASNHVDMVDAYSAKRIQRYYYVSTLRNNKKFLKGWVSRVYHTDI